MTARRAPRSAWPLSIGISALLGDDSLDGSELGDEVGAGKVVVLDSAVVLDAAMAGLELRARWSSIKRHFCTCTTLC